MAAAVPAWLRPNNVATERHQQLVFRHDADGSCMVQVPQQYCAAAILEPGDGLVPSAGSSAGDALTEP